MSIKSNIRKILLVSASVLAGAGIIVLLIAAVNSRTDQMCKGYEIKFGPEENAARFVDKKDIVRVLTDNNNLPVKNRSIRSFDLATIESRLRKEPWVSNAELFFDNNGILKVKIAERSPIARVFTTTGESFYIDSNCKKLPLSTKTTARVPVFTSYPFPMKKTAPGEKALLREMKELSQYVAEHPFWMAQVAQVDITHSRQFEIVPTVGNHVIEIGSARDMEQKFRRLLVFYQQVLAKAGLQKYERIKVQFDNQVIGVKKEANN